MDLCIASRKLRDLITAKVSVLKVTYWKPVSREKLILKRVGRGGEEREISEVHSSLKAGKIPLS